MRAAHHQARARRVVAGILAWDTGVAIDTMAAYQRDARPRNKSRISSGESRSVHGCPIAASAM